jgi:hypothetical protein
MSWCVGRIGQPVRLWRAQVELVVSAVPRPTDPARWDCVRATTAFNKIVTPLGAKVTNVAFEADAVVLLVRPTRRRLFCVCGFSTRAIYDRSVRRWRHLDALGTKVVIEAEIRRAACTACEKVVTEEVTWARRRGALPRAHRRVDGHGPRLFGGYSCQNQGDDLLGPVPRREAAEQSGHRYHPLVEPDPPGPAAHQARRDRPSVDDAEEGKRSHPRRVGRP